MDREKKKWRYILHRLFDITLFLAKQNFASVSYLSQKNQNEFINVLAM
jgi:hypothetical protein